MFLLFGSHALGGNFYRSIWASSPGPMIKGLSFPIISVATCPKTRNKTNQARLSLSKGFHGLKLII